MKNIIITGCSRGIGLSLAKIFTQSKVYNVIGTSTSGESSFKHQNFSCYNLALNEEKSIIDFVAILTKKNFLIDGLINNAAILNEDASNINIDKLQKTLQVNLIGTIDLTEKLLPRLQDKSHIINISSNWGSFSDPNFSALNPNYKISKAALNMYSKLLANRLKDRLVKVSSFDPGWVKTDMGGTDAVKDPLDSAQEIFDLFGRDVESGCFWAGNKIRNW